MFEITIRNAVFEDAAEMANIHINSWRETYGYILPKEYLDERPLYFKNRYELWKKVTVNSSQISIVAECSDNGVVGFINGAKARDTDKEDCCEVWSFYLLKKYHGKKIGYNLLQEFFKKQLALGFSNAYLWVLAG
ncbi:MAG: GNAT superfamily N-acetyltransferase, partial [Thermoproteota archaeon]